MNSEHWVIIDISTKRETDYSITCIKKDPTDPNNLKYNLEAIKDTSVVILKHKIKQVTQPAEPNYSIIFNSLKNTLFEKHIEEKIKIALLNMITSLELDTLKLNTFNSEWYSTEGEIFFLWLDRFGDSILSAFFFSIFYLIPFFGESPNIFEKSQDFDQKLSSSKFPCPDFIYPHIYTTRPFKKYICLFNDLLVNTYKNISSDIKKLFLAWTYFSFFSIDIDNTIEDNKNINELCQKIVKNRVSRSFIFMRDNRKHVKLLKNVFDDKIESYFLKSSFTDIKKQITMMTLTNSLQSRNVFPILAFDTESVNFISNLNQFSGLIQSCVMPINPQFIFDTILDQNMERIKNIPGLNKLEIKYREKKKKYFEDSLHSDTIRKIHVGILMSTFYSNILDFIVENSEVFSCRGNCFLIAEKAFINFYQNVFYYYSNIKVTNLSVEPSINGLTYFIKERFDDIWAKYNNLIRDDYPLDCNSFLDNAVEMLVNEGINVFPENAKNRIIFKLMIKDSLINALKFKAIQIVEKFYTGNGKNKIELDVTLKESISQRAVEYSLLFLTLVYFPYNNYQKMKELNPFFLSSKTELIRPTFYIISVIFFWFDAAYIETIVEILLNFIDDFSFADKIEDLKNVISLMDLQIKDQHENENENEKDPNWDTFIKCPFRQFLTDTKNLKEDINSVKKKREDEKKRIEYEKKRIEEERAEEAKAEEARKAAEARKAEEAKMNEAQTKTKVKKGSKKKSKKGSKKK